MNENEGISAKSEALVVVEEQIEELVRLKSVLERLESSKEAASDAIAVAKDLAEKNTAVVRAAELMTETIAQLNLEESSAVLKESSGLLPNMISAQADAFKSISEHLEKQDEKASSQTTLINDLNDSVSRVNELVRDKTDTLRAELDAHRMALSAARKELQEVITAGQERLSNEIKSAQRSNRHALIVVGLLVVIALSLVQWILTNVGG